MNVYQLSAAFLSEDQKSESSSRMLFTVETDEEATLAAWRWVRNRQKLGRDFFGVLGALKVSRYHIGIPEPTGYINSGSDFGYYEWKYDWGFSPLVPPNES